MNPIVQRTVRFTAAVLATCFAGVALAGAGDVKTEVRPLQPNVTYSAPATAKAEALNVVVGYTVSVFNAGGNTINNIRFTAGTTAPAGTSAAEFLSAEGGNCVATGATTISCNVGQLKAGEVYPTFTVFFKSPTCLTAGGCPAGNTLAFGGFTLYAEGTGGLDTSVPQNSAYPWAAGAVALGTNNPLTVRGAVRRLGGALFTGDTVPTPADLLTTRIDVPAAATYSKADVNEQELVPTVDNPCTIGSSLLRCVATDIRVLDPNDATANFAPDVLTITLRLDASAVGALSGSNGNKKPTVEQLDVQYEGISVQACQVVNGAAVPSPHGTPCIVSRKQYGKSRNGKDFSVDLEDDYEWILINTRNGSYKIL